MNKRQRKKSKNKDTCTLSLLEECFLMAHKINTTEKGCVFFKDFPHVGLVEFEIRVSKEDYETEISRTRLYYPESKNISAHGYGTEYELRMFYDELVKEYKRNGGSEDV